MSCTCALYCCVSCTYFVSYRCCLSCTDFVHCTDCISCTDCVSCTVCALYIFCVLYSVCPVHILCPVQCVPCTYCVSCTVCALYILCVIYSCHTSKTYSFWLYVFVYMLHRSDILHTLCNVMFVQIRLHQRVGILEITVNIHPI